LQNLFIVIVSDVLLIWLVSFPIARIIYSTALQARPFSVKCNKIAKNLHSQKVEMKIKFVAANLLLISITTTNTTTSHQNGYAYDLRHKPV